MHWLFLVAGWYGLWSTATFAVFAADKSSARRGIWRIAEGTLHLLELAGGWPGALAAMRVLRHKRRKWRYWLVTWAIAALHAGIAALAFGYAMSRQTGSAP